MNQTLFSARHIGIREEDLPEILQTIGVTSLDELIQQTVPASILQKQALDISQALTEKEMLDKMKALANQNQVWKTYIGKGYHPTTTPSVILRNIFENPGWYTQYTPYQAEISQGRLEALLNFQTVISELTGLPVANSSLLDEATAAAEAMTMFYSVSERNKLKKDSNKFFVDEQTFQTTKDVLLTRAKPFGIEIVFGNCHEVIITNDYFGAYLQNPTDTGEVHDYTSVVESFHNVEAMVCMGVDLLSLTIMKSPGEMQADCAIGNSQRFGIPMGYGGPHAAFFACKEEFLRFMPGRIIGLSVDAQEQPALRMALQTREQHIKRERATSNICTAQALLAIMAGMYAVWHGPEGLRKIAEDIYHKTSILRNILTQEGISVINHSYFDTLTIATNNTQTIKERAESKQINLSYSTNHISLSLHEETTMGDVEELAALFTGKSFSLLSKQAEDIPFSISRVNVEFLTHPTFHRYRSEAKLMRYIKQLENKDLSLTHAMIPLGSCTMKLNAATELMPLSWPEFSAIHPFAPNEQTIGYRKIIEELEQDLAKITGFAATSLQPNSGAQGEYAGLMTIRAYHQAQKQEQRNIMLIPSSAHGTNPASAVMAGMKVVVVKVNLDGSVNDEDLQAKVEKHKNELAGIMITYPSTNGIYEEGVKSLCSLIHEYGGLVYMDGANMNAQTGLTSPGIIGADVCHLNLHKTFAIPHGGGGPGMGPICVNETLAPFLPTHSHIDTGGTHAISPVSAAPFGSSSILLISYAYIKLLGAKGLQLASEYAILNANYLADALQDDYSILYRGANGRVAHEFIIDLRPFKKSIGIDAEDVAKRLIDYGFHAPTMSWPVPGTIMIEPTESESKEELDRFIHAMKQIREEMNEVEQGLFSLENNVLKHAPHTMKVVLADEWTKPYTRKKAAFPVEDLQDAKFWPSVSRVNNSYGDRNLVCTCPPIEEYV